MKIGIGTYSFGGLESFLGLGLTLKEKFEKIASMGFDMVELLAGDLENDPEDVKAWLKETGLEVSSVHAEPTEENIKKMAAIGGKAVIWAGTPFCNKAEAIEVAQYLDKMAEFAEPYGIKVAYHNHNQEFYFDEGKSLLEHLLDNSTKCYSQLDCGWCQFGGMYPPYFIRKYRNRILTIHVKENSKVFGPGAQPKSRYAKDDRPNPFANVKNMTLEERKALLEKIQAGMPKGTRFDPQCKMGSEESNIDWKEIRAALNEQDFEAFWVIEREAFYGDHDQCIAEDLQWLRENIE